MLCGLWFVVCGLWFEVCGLWFEVCGLWFVVWVVHRRGQSFCSKRKVRPNQAALQLHTRRAAAAAADAADAAATAALQEGVEQQNNSAGAGTGFSGPCLLYTSPSPRD